jgi:hypothetical protein
VLPLVLVSTAYVVAQLVLVLPGSHLGWDETVYVSQVGGNAPPAFFSAPRARGVSYLVAPVAALTASVTALRVYLAVLSGAGLLAALWAWKERVPIAVLAWAGVLFSGLWISLFYGPEAMPNMGSALACLAAAGCFLRVAWPTAGRRTAAPWLGMSGACAVAALVRPGDGVWLVAALALAALAVGPGPGPRLALWAGLAAGLLAGLAPWVVEAWTDYGGLTARLHRAGQIQGGMGWSFALDDQLVSLQGITLCRPCHQPWTHPVTGLWWLALPFFTAYGLHRAARLRRAWPAALACLCSVALAVPYLFLIDYAAPRFLLPSYALLALPVAECLHRVFTRTGKARRTVAAAAAVLLLGHEAVQIAVVSHAAEAQSAIGEQLVRTARRLHRAGVRPPCTVSGSGAVRIAYYTGCASRQIGGHDGSITVAGLRTVARRMPVAVTVSAVDGRTVPPFARDWRRVPLPVRDYSALISPSAASRDRGKTQVR